MPPQEELVEKQDPQPEEKLKEKGGKSAGLVEVNGAVRTKDSWEEELQERNDDPNWFREQK